jgi:hypothetical protein
MPTTPEIHERVAGILSHPENVRIDELVSVLEMLGAVKRPYSGGWLFRIADHRLIIKHPKTGSELVPRYSVCEFRDLMIEMGLFA